jgi:hypothetical protein
MTRVALLIGVAETSSAPDFAPLAESVAADLAGFREALESSGYDVRVLENPGRAQIGATIFELAREVPEDGTFLVYFTGHGIRLADTDYLLPADAQAPPDGEWGPVYQDSLQPADISRYLEKCRAGTVLWLIDACRDEVAGSAFGSRIVQGPPHGGFALMVGCDLGERCGYSPDGSFFTKGLVEAFSSMSAPRTVHEVYEAVRATTSRLAAKHRLKQRVQIRYGTDREEQTRETQVCAGRHLMDEWRAVVTDDRLWRLVTASDHVPRLHDELLSLVESCARQVQHADKRLPDRWADDDFVPRLLLRTLPLIVPPTPCFSAVEMAALIGAVFLHEGAWADKRSQAADITPHVRGRHQDADVHRRHLEQVHDQYAHVSRKIDPVRSRCDFDDWDVVALWLVHRWIAERFETDEKPIPPDQTVNFAQAVLSSTDTGRIGEFTGAVTRLAASIGTEPPLDIAVDCATRKVLLQGEKQLFRERPLAALLRLAGVLAVDARVFPEVAAEHLGASDPLTPEDVVATVREFVHWSNDGATLDMDALCPHQALHAGLEEVAERADRLVAQTGKLADDLPESEGVLLARVPGRVTVDELRPRQVDGQKAYEVPLLRFQLAQNEVRDLLMGKQLYGSPNLALRELYQNAMDACRYRAMRWEYLRRLGKRPADWDGRISIVQGEDDRGRYVECRDNGVGMGWDQLINTFTKAGSRFEQSRLFRQEQAAWLRFDATLRLYPNSRFGIGVFSYFMLADEMSIVTRPVSRDGVPAQDAWRVEISSSGSLFRILKHAEADDGVAEGGTRIRLYLRDDAELLSLSSTKTLGELIAVSEFHLEVQDDSKSLQWEPGVLYPERAHKSDSAQVAVPGVLWWVNDGGAILCDGIVTDKKPFGYVLNLTGAHAGELSVNRKELLSYDQTWERHTWEAGAPQVLGWSKFTLDWLWELDAKNLAVARVIWRAVRGSGVQVTTKWTSQPHDLDSVGVTSIDVKVAGVHDRYGGRRPRTWFFPWRTAVLHLPYAADHRSAPRDLIGHPVLEPGDTETCLGDIKDWEDLPKRPRQDWTWAAGSARRTGVTVADVLRSLRRARIAHPMFAPPRALPGELDWQPSYTDGRLIGELAGHDEVREMNASDDVRDLVLASNRLHRQLGELVSECARYTPLRLAPPPDVPLQHQEHICTEEDVAMLYVFAEVKEQHPIHDGKRIVLRTTHPSDVCAAAERCGVPTDVVLERLRQFSWLGWTVPSPEAVAGWAAVPADTHDILRQFSDGQALDWAATVVLAAVWDISLNEAEGELVEIADLTGLDYMRRFATGDGGDLVPSESVAELLSDAHKQGKRAMSQGLSMEDLVHAMPEWIYLEDLPEIVDELAEMGIQVPSYVLLFDVWDDLPLRSRYAFSGNDPDMEGCDYPTEPTACVLFVASSALKESLREMWKTAKTEASRFGLSVPTLPKALADSRPTSDEVQALVNVGSYDEFLHMLSPKWTVVTMFRLARYAHETKLNGSAAYERLASFRPLGALVPELPPEVLLLLEKSTPSKHDLLALEGTHRVTGPDEPLVPLDLVSIAARLGEPISETWQRFVPYLALTVEPAVSHFPDVVPFWQDFAILTKYLDGLLPAIEGRVDPAHVEFVAREVGESEEWVWGRLKLYETMFALDLSDMPAED